MIEVVRSGSRRESAPSEDAEGRRTWQVLVGNFLSLAAGKTFSQLLAFLAVVWLARRLGVAGLGQVALAQAVLAYFTLETDLGLKLYGVREIARHPQDHCRLVENITTMRILLSVLAFALLLGLTFAVPHLRQVSALLLLFGLSLFPYAAYLDWVLQGLERMVYVGLAEIIRCGAFLGLLYVAVSKPAHLLRVGGFYAIGTAAASAFLLLLHFGSRRGFQLLRPRFELKVWKHYLSEALPMGCSYLVIGVYFTVDILMLAFLKGDTAVGWYNAAYKVLTVTSGIGGLYFISLSPVISRLYVESRERLQEVLNKSAKLAILAAVPLSVGTLFAAKPVVFFLYGPSYLPSVAVLKVLMLSVSVVWVGAVFGYALLNCDRQLTHMRIVLVGGICVVVLNALLIPRFSILGSAWAILITQLLVAAAAYWKVRLFVTVRVWPHAWKALASVAVMSLVLWFSHLQNLFALIVLGALSYGVALCGTGALQVSAIQRWFTMKAFRSAP